MSAVSPEAGAYISHLMVCRSCYAPRRIHCPAGLALQLHSDASYIAALPDLAQRRYWRESQRKRHPQDMDRLDALIKQIFEERKSGGNMADKAG